MKRIVLLLVCILSLSMVFAAFDKNESDRLFYEENDYEADFAYLSEALKSAENNEEKAEILWRMSRTRLTLTDENKEKLIPKLLNTVHYPITDNEVAEFMKQNLGG